MRLDNRTARRLWLEANGLLSAPVGAADVLSTVKILGFVQIDSIRHVERAQDHILWSRDRRYRPGGLEKALRRRELFEHFTHDASMLPMEMLPYWRRQFERHAARISNASWWSRVESDEVRAEMKARIGREGALCTRDFESGAARTGEMWHRPAHKQSLDYMWYAGELATCHRENFVKFYDLAENVFPADLLARDVPDAAQVDWLCRRAMAHMGVADAGEIKRFWEACDLAEVKEWLACSDLVECEVEAVDGRWRPAYATRAAIERVAELGKPAGGMRILNPFDPAIRDRKRVERLFGFDYRIEIFVPKEKRQWGYYVYPLLQGDRLVGRVELAAERKAGVLRLEQLWPEDGVRWSDARQDALLAELARFARFAGLSLS